MARKKFYWRVKYSLKKDPESWWIMVSVGTSKTQALAFWRNHVLEMDGHEPRKCTVISCEAYKEVLP